MSHATNAYHGQIVVAARANLLKSDNEAASTALLSDRRSQ